MRLFAEANAAEVQVLPDLRASTGELGHLMEGGEGRVWLRPAYLIDHPKGRRCSTPACTRLPARSAARQDA
jgi:hypothetical protein